MNGASVVAAADAVLRLYRDIVLRRKVGNFAVKVHVVNRSFIHKGDNGTEPLFADEFVPGDVGDVPGGGGFDNHRNIRVGAEGGGAGAVAADFFPGGETDGEAVLGFAFEKFH